MEEVFSLKGDGHAWHGDIIIVTGAVVDICANSKCNWFGLPGGTKDKIDENVRLCKKYKCLSNTVAIVYLFGKIQTYNQREGRNV